MKSVILFEEMCVLVQNLVTNMTRQTGMRQATSGEVIIVKIVKPVEIVNPCVVGTIFPLFGISRTINTVSINIVSLHFKRGSE